MWPERATAEEVKPRLAMREEEVLRPALANIVDEFEWGVVDGG